MPGPCACGRGKPWRAAAGKPEGTDPKAGRWPRPKTRPAAPARRTVATTPSAGDGKRRGECLPYPSGGGWSAERINTEPGLVGAAVFLYRALLERDINLGRLVRARKPQRLPVVLRQEEVSGRTALWQWPAAVASGFREAVGGPEAEGAGPGFKPLGTHRTQRKRREGQTHNASGKAGEEAAQPAGRGSRGAQTGSDGRLGPGKTSRCLGTQISVCGGAGSGCFPSIGAGRIQYLDEKEAIILMRV